MSIAAVVPVWNGRELLERLLASLARADTARRGGDRGGQRLDRRRAGTCPRSAARA